MCEMHIVDCDTDVQPVEVFGQTINLCSKCRVEFYTQLKGEDSAV